MPVHSNSLFYYLQETPQGIGNSYNVIYEKITIFRQKKHGNLCKRPSSGKS